MRTQRRTIMMAKAKAKERRYNLKLPPDVAEFLWGQKKSFIINTYIVAAIREKMARDVSKKEHRCMCDIPDPREAFDTSTATWCGKCGLEIKKVKQ